MNINVPENMLEVLRLTKAMRCEISPPHGSRSSRLGRIMTNVAATPTIDALQKENISD